MVVRLQYLIGRQIGSGTMMRWLQTGFCLIFLGVVGFSLSLSTAHWCLAIAVFTLGEIMVFPVKYMLIDHIAPSELRGKYFGAQNLSHLGGALGPVLCGWVLASADPIWMFIMLGTFILVAAALYQRGATIPRHMLT